MIELIQQINYWHWLAFGLVLVALELLGTAGYFLWLGISAVLVGVIFAMLPISWQLQWLTFASFSLITTWLWWRKQFKSDHDSDKSRKLNQKQKQLIGQTARLTEDIQQGTFRLTLGDTTWTAQCKQDIAAGSLVKVVEVDGIVLIVEPQ
ncbi:NfeD family protein [Vibrio aestuarianus]|uniref:NfeD family protein n=1 Tax=Vibrio aestuarianus TaxID=28171 RepID=UPI00237C5B96|nr:NfeD family protein [Vibrio aestuarianus]MDE1349791.1 NfeD family protein [Vibrio aestuarianus]